MVSFPLFPQMPSELGARLSCSPEPQPVVGERGEEKERREEGRKRGGGGEEREEGREKEGREERRKEGERERGRGGKKGRRKEETTDHDLS